eukprot:gene3872-4415_t
MSTRQGATYGLLDDDVTYTTRPGNPPYGAPSYQQSVQQTLSTSYKRIEDDQASLSSGSSQQTSSSAASVRSKAKAEAAKAKVAFAKKRAELVKQAAYRAAQLEADMAVLQAEQEAAIAAVEESVYEAADQGDTRQMQLDLPSLTSVTQMTENYVNAHFSKETSTQCEAHQNSSHVTNTQIFQPMPQGSGIAPGGGNWHLDLTNQSQPAPVTQQALESSNQQEVVVTKKPRSHSPPAFNQGGTLPVINQLPEISGWMPTMANSQPRPAIFEVPELSGKQSAPLQSQSMPGMYQTPQLQQPDPFTSLTKHLMKKELISTGFLKFDENPANFRAWKASFKLATEDLELTAAQELNLVMKWLGEKSSKIVAPLRAINIENPQVGLQMVWETLEKKYGTAEVLEESLTSRLEKFPKFNAKDGEKLQQLAYLLLEIQAAKRTGIYKGLAVLDSAKGLRQMVEKLPFPLQERWMRVGTTYKRQNNATFPPFEVFVEIVNQEADMRNDVSFLVSPPQAERPVHPKPHRAAFTHVNKTAVSLSSTPQGGIDPSKACILHSSSHALRDCRAFQKKLISERKQLLMKNRICFRCCSSTTHQAKDCNELVKCSSCNSNKHLLAMHIGPVVRPAAQEEDGGENTVTQTQQQANESSFLSRTNVSNSCTSVCGTVPGGKSCSKICKLEVFDDITGRSMTVYDVIDDQSNSTLAKPEILDKLDVASEPITYKMKTCAGETLVTGRSTSALSVRSCNGHVTIKLPYVRECSNIPDNHSEIPEIAKAYAHLKHIVDKVEPMEPSVPIALLIGRDVLQAHKVREQIEGPENAPFAKRLDLGWVIIGESCLDFRRDNLIEPCQSHVTVLDDVFATTREDNMPAKSIEDQQFLSILDAKARKNEAGNWEMPLPFKPQRERLHNNKPAAMKRFNSVARRIRSNAKLAEQYQAFMQKLIENGHAEPAPPFEDDQEGRDAAAFVRRNFYVDDGLTSTATPEEATDLPKRTKAMLSESNINLHKVSSNSQEVMLAFNPDDRAKDLKDIDLSKDEPPVQRSLGISWNLKDDKFLVTVSPNDKKFTRRGLLPVVNSLYDPLGFAAPVTLKGRLLMRELTTGTVDWDDPIEPEKRAEWNAWTDSLEALHNLAVSRCYTGSSLQAATNVELIVFTDASTVAIGAVSYLRAFYGDVCKTGFVMAKSKVAPKPAHTIPRLELCAAVLGVELSEIIKKEIGFPLQDMKFYTDSRFVLGYISNTSRRFYTYVTNRVNRIRQSTSPTQWNYVNTASNPADLASRSSTAVELSASNWFEGPAFLKQECTNPEKDSEQPQLIDPEKDVEVRPESTTFMTGVQSSGLGSHRFSRFSNWGSLRATIARLIQVARAFKNHRREGWEDFRLSPNPATLKSAELVILATVQQESYPEEVQHLQNKQHISRDSPLRKLAPTIGENGLIRVGGRCERQEVPYNQKHPLVLPQKSHVTELVIRHYHEATRHQGHKLTEGAIRNAGLWVTGSKRLVSAMISKCVTCKKLRGAVATQTMADLPLDRIEPGPPIHKCWLGCFWTMGSCR